ncbi:MAG: hypothetical protein WCR06_03350 [bacterium]
MIEFQHGGVHEKLKPRRLLCADVPDFLQRSLPRTPARSRRDWQVELGDTLLFDAPGLRQLEAAIAGYAGPASRLKFSLAPSAEALRDYYSHNCFQSAGQVLLPITAFRAGCSRDDSLETLQIALPELSTAIHFPRALAPPGMQRTPLALLLPYSCDHDLLFANQIAIISNIAACVRSAPWIGWRALFARRRGSLRQRAPLYWTRIHPSACIHPTAVIEGSIIGADCRVGAHCVVRYSVLGQHVVLQDGAKVEFSAVDDHSWLMHDLTFYRSVAERNVFLIHGPYQFSYFQHTSAAFATIMMDYRPDARPIAIATPAGVRKYEGRFLGALLEERARIFGGTLTAPGITIPAERELFASHVVRARDLLPAPGPDVP